MYLKVRRRFSVADKWRTKPFDNTKRKGVINVKHAAYEDFGIYFGLIYLVLLIPLLLILAAIYGLCHIVSTLFGKRKTGVILFAVSELLLVALTAAVKNGVNTVVPILGTETEITISLTSAPIVCAVLCFVIVVFSVIIKKADA